MIMRKIFLIFLFYLNLFASNVINYDLVESENKIDLVFKFDSPYDKNNNIQIFKNDGYNIILFKDMVISENNKKIPLKSSFIDSLFMYLVDTNTVLKFKTNNDLGIFIANNNQNFELKIRIVPQNKINLMKNNESSFNIFNYFIFIVVIAFFVVMLVKIRNKRKMKLKYEIATLFNLNIDKIRILNHKTLDKYNKFVSISYDGDLYKFIIGEKNIFLNNFVDYKYNDDKIGCYIKESALNSYKEKISKL